MMETVQDLSSTNYAYITSWYQCEVDPDDHGIVRRKYRHCVIHVACFTYKLTHLDTNRHGVSQRRSILRLVLDHKLQASGRFWESLLLSR